MRSCAGDWRGGFATPPLGHQTPAVPCGQLHMHRSVVGMLPCLSQPQPSKASHVDYQFDTISPPPAFLLLTPLHESEPWGSSLMDRHLFPACAPLHRLQNLSWCCHKGFVQAVTYAPDHRLHQQLTQDPQSQMLHAVPLQSAYSNWCVQTPGSAQLQSLHFLASTHSSADVVIIWRMTLA